MVEIIEAYELSYGQWGIFLFACASVHKVGTTVENLVSKLTDNLIHAVSRFKRKVGTFILRFKDL